MRVEYGNVSSDHFPLRICIDIPKIKCTSDEALSHSGKHRVKWDSLTESNIQAYTATTARNLSKVVLNHDLLMCNNVHCNDQDHIKAIDTMYDGIMGALHLASQSVLKSASSKSKHAAVPGWNDYMEVSP